MQKLVNKNVMQKIMLVLVIAILCNFIVPNYCHAGDGGVLLDPIRWFVSFLGDAVISLVNMGFTGQWVFAGAAKADAQAGDWKNYWDENGVSGEIDWPTILISPEEIFQGKVLALDVNFLQSVDSKLKGKNLIEINKDEKVSIDESLRGNVMYGGEYTKTSITNLRAEIARWYLIIRNLSATALFCVLIYIGIRILISSISEERAKYKSMMTNWVVAICLVFFLHYIMATVMYITEKAVLVVGSAMQIDYTIYRPGTKTQENFRVTGSAVAGGIKDEDIKDGKFDAKVHNLVEYVRVYVNSESTGLALRIFGYIYSFNCIYNYIYSKIFEKIYVYGIFNTNCTFNSIYISN